MAEVRIACQFTGCEYIAEHDSESIAIAMLNSHGNIHSSTAEKIGAKQKMPRIDRPVIRQDLTGEDWLTFIAEWDRFKRCTEMENADIADQLFQCCEAPLRRLLLKENPKIIESGEKELMSAIRRMAVIHIATSVRRTNLLSTKQDFGTSAREFYAHVRASAATCEFKVKCPHECCAEKDLVDYTPQVVKDILIAGIADTEIYKDVLSIANLDEKTDREILRFIEEKEIARDACPPDHSYAASVSSYKRRPLPQTDESSEIKKKLSLMGNCQRCKTKMHVYKIFRSQNVNKEPFKICLDCFRLEKRRKSPRVPEQDVNGIFKVSECSTIVGFLGAIEKKPDQPGVITDRDIQESHQLCCNSVILDHYIFTPNGWKKAQRLNHPSFTAVITTHQDDYHQFEKNCPRSPELSIDIVADSGAQSCLWSLDQFLSCGLKRSDLLPVRMKLNAANCAPITVAGAIFLRFAGMSFDRRVVEAAAMVYVSPEAKSFFASHELLKQLGIIPKTFPQIGDIQSHRADDSLVIDAVEHHDETARASCGCLRRAMPPGKPKQLPFECKMENTAQMKQWLLDRYASSTFNKCPHQVLPQMDGPPIELHVDKDARPVNLKTPVPIPLHWQDKVLEDLNRDVDLGVLEKVPYGHPSPWCFRMVICRKYDGNPRRTVDLSPLNKFCVREAHPSRSPFHCAKSIPPNSIKSVFDAWNGFHSVPLKEEDKHYTTFTTPWGLFRYNRAPQGFLSSGDGYVRRFDDITGHILRQARCVDDSLLHDPKYNVEEHWWRVIEFLEITGRGGVVLNPEKFQFAQDSVDFAGFRVTRNCVEPLPKFLDAIQEYPTPVNITDIRSWFGLVNQMSHYAQLREMMEPFRKFLSPKTKFEWSEDLAALFEESKIRIIEAIRQGVQIFDPTKRTVLRSDWSRTGIGFWLQQKHCTCPQNSPGCCLDGWRIVLAGSRFLSQTESNYAAVEGEALAVAWGLEQSRYFTLGCDNLLVIVDHKPLVKIFGDRRLDEIENPRLFRIKQKTLMWRFDIEYQSGKTNCFADATSRRPSTHIEPSNQIVENQCYDSEDLILAGVEIDIEKFFAVTADRVREETKNDTDLMMIANLIACGFPKSRLDLPGAIREFWEYRDCLSVSHDLIIYKDRIVIPCSLREKVLENLHSAHQGITSMLSRAQACIFWPGFSRDISRIRHECHICHRNAPSHAKLPPVVPRVPKAPFELIVADYFSLHGKHYLVVGDRLSGWTEVVHVEPSSATSGSKGLCKALRQVFVTFGVPEEISSDGGPEFIGMEFKEFLKRWGVTHRLSSAYFAQSNGRAELAVKTTKRLLETNVDAYGGLNTDKFVRALLQQRNTPDRICKLSPAEVLFGRPLRDSLPQLNKSIMIFDNPLVDDQWRETWKAKETALRSRIIDNCEKLGEHTMSLRPLHVGDSVFIQNQGAVPNRPKKWDKQGTIVSVGKFDQYLVRVTGSGRLTLRNRRFLRKFRDLAHNHPVHAVQPCNTQFQKRSVNTDGPKIPLPDPTEQEVIPEKSASIDERNAIQSDDNSDSFESTGQDRNNLQKIFDESSDDEEFMGFPANTID